MIITHLNFAKGFRGGERQTQLLIEELSKRGYHQRVVVRQNAPLIKRLEGIGNLEIIPIAKPYIWHLSCIKGSSILHAHEAKAAQFAFIANALYKIPYIITRRVDNPISQNLFNAKMYRNSFRTVALSKAIQKEVLKVDKGIDIEIIPSASSGLSSDPKQVEAIKKRFKGKFLIANIAELQNKQKGQYYLIEAMKKLQQNYPDIHLLLLGKGEDREAYEAQAKELKNISFEGFVDNVGDYLQAIELFVFPSLNEGLGSILLDVMEHGIATVASDVGGIPDIIKEGQNGLLIPPKDSEAIYEAIEKLYLNSTLRQQLAREAIQMSVAFNAAAMCERYIKIYKEMA
ncbi:MAG: glycosyltransferase family 4 protein [Campylobacterales bacterium]|nr:glycosyltransferase family 4 protein [Campylobacterales bacterium]